MVAYFCMSSWIMVIVNTTLRDGAIWDGGYNTSALFVLQNAENLTWHGSMRETCWLGEPTLRMPY